MNDAVPPPFLIPRSILSDVERLGPLLNVGSEIAALVHTTISRDLAGQSMNSCDFKLAAYVLLIKGLKTFHAIQTLCRCGFGSDALALCGSLFENVVDLAYMKLAPVRRPLRFMQHEQVGKYLQLQKSLKQKRLPRGERKTLKRYLTNIAPQVGKLLKYYPDPGSGWAQKSIRQRAKAVGLLFEYENLYWVFCGHKHSLPMAVPGFFVTTEDEPESAAGPNARGIYHATLHSTDYLLRLFVLFIQAYSVNKETELKKLAKSLGDAAIEVYQKHPDLCE
jgi:hypothetical protein